MLGGREGGHTDGLTDWWVHVGREGGHTDGLTDWWVHAGREGGWEMD